MQSSYFLERCRCVEELGEVLGDEAREILCASVRAIQLAHNSGRVFNSLQTVVCSHALWRWSVVKRCELGELTRPRLNTGRDWSRSRVCHGHDIEGKATQPQRPPLDENCAAEI